MNTKNPKVDGYLRKAKQWRNELTELRRIILDSPLIEEVKWRIPCYTLQGKNVLLLNGLKNFCALAFVKGVLLKDPSGLLAQPGQHTQVGRWIKFTSVGEILAAEPVLKAYIAQAIEVEKSGAKAPMKTTSQYPLPAEFKTKLRQTPGLKKAFAALTPGRQRAYILYFSGAKQSTTRAARVEKSVQRILEGKGLDDD